MTATRQTLFIGGQVFDGEGKMLQGHGVLVDGQRVARVAPAAEFEGYAGMQVNTTGMTLMPSLADCHVHLVYTGGADPNAQPACAAASRRCATAAARTIWNSACATPSRAACSPAPPSRRPAASSA
ncbi:hypothetical protein G6F68_017720 [Rhizopus microsporus]|nr:hypothetical protein G6F68_017720 [Rhizopus microsporus]